VRTLNVGDVGPTATVHERGDVLRMDADNFTGVPGPYRAWSVEIARLIEVEEHGTLLVIAPTLDATSVGAARRPAVLAATMLSVHRHVRQRGRMAVAGDAGPREVVIGRLLVRPVEGFDDSYLYPVAPRRILSVGAEFNDATTRSQ
jgi:hypothetical protein